MLANTKGLFDMHFVETLEINFICSLKCTLKKLIFKVSTKYVSNVPIVMANQESPQKWTKIKRMYTLILRIGDLVIIVGESVYVTLKGYIRFVYVFYPAWYPPSQTTDEPIYGIAAVMVSFHGMWNSGPELFRCTPTDSHPFGIVKQIVRGPEV